MPPIARKRTFCTAITQSLYDGMNAVQELNGAAPPSQTANLLTGLRIDEYFTRTDTATSTFLADALGSTIGLVTSNNGPIATNYTYQPFGATTAGGSANGNSYEFTGRENDGTGSYFYRARYYPRPSRDSLRKTRWISTAAMLTSTTWWETPRLTS